MLMLPLSTHLRLGRRPYVTYAVAVLCVLIYLAQDARSQAIEDALGSFCASIQAADEETAPRDVLAHDEQECRDVLRAVHESPDWGRLQDTIDSRIRSEPSDEQQAYWDDFVASIDRHYPDFRLVAPPSLNARLMFDPNYPNPLRSLTSMLSHADWWHLIGNLIFFLAFAPALELLAGSALRFIGVMLLTAVAGDIFYALFAVLGGVPVPTLGLSGVVTGMIGFSAYMMPHARIRTFIWFLHFARIVYLPAWILAVWYIGWDAWTLFADDDYGGVNMVAHVVGGVSGYLAGVMFFRRQREEYRDELEDEIDFMHSERVDAFGLMSSYKGQRKELIAREQQRRAETEYHAYLDALHRLVNAGKSGEALLLLLDRHDTFCSCPETYEAIFNEMRHWRTGRTWLCLGRLLIELFLANRKLGRALHVARQCLAVDPDFVLASTTHLYPLARYARESGQPELAYQLLRDAAARYPGAAIASNCRELEQELQAIAHLAGG